MRKILLALLTFLYLSMSVGLTINIHYCMGRVLHVDLYKDHSNDHCCKGMKGCCNEKQKFYKLPGIRQNTVCKYSFTPYFTAITNNYPSYKRQFTLNITRKPFTDSGSPPYLRRSAYILNSVFRI